MTVQQPTNFQVKKYTKEFSLDINMAKLIVILHRGFKVSIAQTDPRTVGTLYEFIEIARNDSVQSISD